MALANLREFLQAIETAGELVRVSHPVRARLEAAEIADRCMKSPGGGPALLFEHVAARGRRRSPHPVAINLFGSMRRMCLALGVEDLETIGGRISELLEMKVPEGLFGKLAMLPKLAEVGKFPPRVRGGRAALPGGRAARRCREPRRHSVSHDLARRRGPLHHAAHGRHPRSRRAGSGTSGCIASRCSAEHARDALAAAQGRGGALARDGGARRDDAGRASPSAGIRRGIYSGSAPLPPTIDEFLFAGFLRREPVELAKAVTCDLEVPADAEFVLEGYIDPRRAAGRSRGRSAITPASTPWRTLPTGPRHGGHDAARPDLPDDDRRPSTDGGLLPRTRDRADFLPLLKLTVPEIVDYHMPAEGIFHNLVFVSIDKQYPGQAYKVMNAIWGRG